jgi:hypothetical protein
MPHHTVRTTPLKRYVVKVVEVYRSGYASISFQSMGPAPALLPTPESIFTDLGAAWSHMLRSAKAARQMKWKRLKPNWLRPLYAFQYDFAFLGGYKRTYILIEYSGSRADLLDITKEVREETFRE